MPNDDPTKGGLSAKKNSNNYVSHKKSNFGENLTNIKEGEQNL